MALQHTTYHYGPPDLKDVPTISAQGQTTRDFSAQHVVDLRASFAAVPLSTGPLRPDGALPPDLPPVTHYRLSAGKRLEHRVPIQSGDTPQTWAGRACAQIADFALANPADL